MERYLNGRGGAARAGPRPKATVREGSRYLRAELAGIRRSGRGAVGGPRAGRLELNGVEASRAAVPPGRVGFPLPPCWAWRPGCLVPVICPQPNVVLLPKIQIREEG